MPMVHIDQFAQVFDTERRECDDVVVAGAVDPDHAIFGLHIDGEIEDPIDSFTQFGCNTVDGDRGRALPAPVAPACSRAFQAAPERSYANPVGV